MEEKIISSPDYGQNQQIIDDKPDNTAKQDTYEIDNRRGGDKGKK